MLHVCQSIRVGVSASVCVCGRNWGSKDCEQDLKCLCRFAGLSHPQKPCVGGKRARHVNEHLRARVLKLETDLCSVRDQLFKGHPEQARSLLCKPCSLSDPGDARPILSWHTGQTHKHPSDHFLLLCDVNNFRFRWRYTDIQCHWLIGSYGVLRVSVRKN